MSSPDPGPSDEQLARLVVRLLAAVLALLLAGGVAAATQELADRDGGETAADVVVAGAGLSPRGGIGPLPGTSVGPYVRSRRAALDGAPAAARRTAVVSFASYRTPDEARAALAGTDASALLVAFPGGRPVAAGVDVSIDALVSRQRDEAAAEKKALEQLLPTVEDDDFRRQYTADIARLTAFLGAPRQAPPSVYAAVVTATVEQLRRLAGSPGIRLVDVGATAAVPGAGDAAGLRPEETRRAGAPATRPV